jgi:hypothetical protein
MRPAQIAVMIPAVGVLFEATASDTESGIETRETVKPDCQLQLIFAAILETIDCIDIMKILLMSGNPQGSNSTPFFKFVKSKILYKVWTTKNTLSDVFCF